MSAPTGFINYIKDTDPLLAEMLGYDDEAIYLYGRRKGLNLQYQGDATWAEVDEINLSPGSTYQADVPPTISEKSEARKAEVTAPRTMNALYDMLDGPITEESAAVWRKAYVESMTGKLDELYHGKARYDISDYESTILNDIVSGIASFIMPIDALTFWGGGKFVGGPLMRLAEKGMSRRLAANASSKFGITQVQGGVMGSANMAGTLATF